MIQGMHEVHDALDNRLAVFSGDVPRAGDTVWLKDGAHLVTEVCWWIYEGHGSKACVYVGPLDRKGG